MARYIAPENAGGMYAAPTANYGDAPNGAEGRMAFALWINHKRYTVGDHAARRMMERAISEDMIVCTMEDGLVVDQKHHTDLYEHTFYDDTLQETITIRVIVDERQRLIMTVIDLTAEDESS